MKPYGVSGEVIDIKELQSVTFTLNGREFTNAFLVCALPTDAAGLLGTDFLEKAGAMIDFVCGQMSLTGIGNVSRVFSVPPARHSALTVFTESKAGRSSQLNLQEARHKGEQSSASPVPRSIRSKAEHG